MKITHKEDVWVLRHSSGKYFASACGPQFIDDCLTDDPLQAFKFFSKEQAECNIKLGKDSTKNCRWPSERVMMQALADSEPKHMTITTEGEVDD